MCAIICRLCGSISSADTTGATGDLELLGDEKARVEEVRRLWPDDAAGFARLLRKGESIWNLSSDAFLFHSPEQMFGGRFSLAAALRLLTIPIRIGMFISFAKAIDRNIQNERLRQLLYQYATYTGVNPFHAPATLLIIPFVEMVFGAWYIPGGMYRLAEGMDAVARKVGVEIRSGCGVGGILVEEGTCGLKPARRACVVGVRTEAGEILRGFCRGEQRCGLHLSQSHRSAISQTLLRCHASEVRSRRQRAGADARRGRDVSAIRRITTSSCQMITTVIWLHVRRAKDSGRSVYLRLCLDPTDPTQAPDGCESLFILADAPPVDGTDRLADRRPALS